MVLADVLPERKFRNEGTFGCSPGTKTATRVNSHVPRERKPERGYIRQNRPFTKPPFYLPVRVWFGGEFTTPKSSGREDLFEERVKNVVLANKHVRIWVGLSYLRVSLFYLRLVFVAYGQLA